jgi:hypothetical protein
MRLRLGHVLAIAATTGVFAVVAPVSSASAYSWPFGLPDINGIGGQAGSFGCGSNAPAGNGTAGGTANQTCGALLSFIGPSIGEIASVMEPTIIGSTVLAPVTVSAGPVQH